MVGREEKIQ
jgi:hypothetical protein